MKRLLSSLMISRRTEAPMQLCRGGARARRLRFAVSQALRCGVSAAALAGMATALPAAAQFAKPEDAIKYRKSAMFLEVTHLGRIAAMANGRAPFDAKVMAENAEILAAVSKWQFTGFVGGSDKGDTNAKPEIWTEMDKFKEKAAKSQEDVVKLNAAAKTGNLDTIKTAVGAVGQSCKACHDAYRKE